MIWQAKRIILIIELYAPILQRTDIMLETQLEYILSKTDAKPKTAIVLGSGLGDFADGLNAAAVINYADIPDFPVSTAPGHKGRFIFANIAGEECVLMQGRVHLYEGYTAAQTAVPIRLMRLMGAENLILTNAAGGINKNLNPGDFMIIEDHISSFVPSPLTGKNDESLGVRFPDMSNVYDKELIKLIKSAAAECGINIKKGVYIQLGGPAFETKAEIKMCSMLGADAVGMSTATEAQAAKHCGFRVCGISCITNLACGLRDVPITSEEVNETGARTAKDFAALITTLTEKIHNG